MDGLHSEIRAAFEKEQAPHPPPVTLRHEVVSAVAAQHVREPRLQWVAIAAALLIGVLVVGGLMATRLAQHPPVPTGPFRDYGLPPAGVPLLYVIDPRNQTSLQGYDWNAKPRGTVKLPGKFDSVLPGIGIAPDGSGFAISAQGTTVGTEYLDRLGRPIAPGILPEITDIHSRIWADDNRHLCFLRFDVPSRRWTLLTKLPGEGDNPIGAFATEPPNGQIDDALLACSFKSDLAIAVRRFYGQPAELWVIRLSDGKVLTHKTYQEQQLTSLVASQDGLYLAEYSGTISAPQIPQPTIIRRVADWKQIADLGLSAEVIAFSADDSRLLVSNTMLYDNLEPASLSVLDFASGRTLWTYTGPEAFGGFAVQPDGSGFAIALMAPTQVLPSPCGQLGQPTCQQIDDQFRDVLIVHGDGSIAKIPGRYEPTW